MLFSSTFNVICSYGAESQNVRGWKGPLWVIQSNPLLKQGHLQKQPKKINLLIFQVSSRFYYTEEQKEQLTESNVLKQNVFSQRNGA